MRALYDCAVLDCRSQPDSSFATGRQHGHYRRRRNSLTRSRPVPVASVSSQRKSSLSIRWEVLTVDMQASIASPSLRPHAPTPIRAYADTPL